MLNFCPNHFAVADFLERRRSFPLARNVGASTDSDSNLIRIDFSFLIEHASNREAPWAENLTRAEQLLLDTTRRSERWSLEADLQRAVFHPDPALPSSPFLDELLIHLDDSYSSSPDGFVPGTYLYAHEVFYDFIKRIVLGTATELALSDLLPEVTFFRSICPWVERGHLPYGWSGAWPSGALMLW